MPPRAVADQLPRHRFDRPASRRPTHPLPYNAQCPASGKRRSFWADRYSHRMPQWKLIRLELDPTPEFPAGSASRAYMLRLPLQDDGLIDATAMAASPAMASVRRFWPNEPDQQGYLIRKGDGWAFSYALGEDDDEGVYHLESHPIRL